MAVFKRNKLDKKLPGHFYLFYFNIKIVFYGWHLETICSPFRLTAIYFKICFSNIVSTCQRPNEFLGHERQPIVTDNHLAAKKEEKVSLVSVQENKTQAFI